MTQFGQGEEAASCQFCRRPVVSRGPRRKRRAYKERIGLLRSTIATMGVECVQLLVNTKRNIHVFPSCWSNNISSCGLSLSIDSVFDIGRNCVIPAFVGFQGFQGLEKCVPSGKESGKRRIIRAIM
ncbi:hypothetical protein F5Y11DRAFT_318436, partial [Daldinia sp. FL1419]